MLGGVTASWAGGKLGREVRFKELKYFFKTYTHITFPVIDFLRIGTLNYGHSFSLLFYPASE